MTYRLMAWVASVVGLMQMAACSRTVQWMAKHLGKVGRLGLNLNQVALALFMGTLMGTSMHAQAGLFGGTKGWKEEIQLHDGQVMVVERHFNLGGYPSPDARERAVLDQTITFTVPGSAKTIAWKTEYRYDSPELNSLSPLLLNVVDGIPYLATSPAGCIAYNKWGRPNPPYILFKYVSDTWQRIALEEFPPMLVKANLMPTPATSLLKSYYSLASKAEQQSGNMHAYARTIVRVAVKGGESITSCHEMVFYKGAWVGPGDSIGKRMMDNRSK